MKPTMLRSTLIPLAAVAVFASLSPIARAQDTEREIRAKIDYLNRQLVAKREQLNAATAQRREVESQGRAFKEEHDTQTASIERLNGELRRLRDEATEHNRQAIDLEKQVRAKVEQQPDVAAAAERFAKIDAARERIHDSTLARVRTEDAYLSAQAELERLTARHAAFVAGGGDAQETAHLAAMIASQKLTLQQLEAEALSGSDTYEQARRAADEANRALIDARAAHQGDYDAEPRLVSARAALELARSHINARSKDLADAKRAQSDAASKMKKANAYYVALGQQIAELDKDIRGIEYAIRQLHNKL